MSYFFIRGGESYRHILNSSKKRLLSIPISISIIIPNKDHIEDLDLCIKSIHKRSIYKNYENIAYTGNKELDTLDLICNNSYITYVAKCRFTVREV